MKANQVSQFQDNPNIQSEIQNIYQILNKVSFGTSFDQRGENFDAYLLEGTANSSAGEDTTLTHNLKRVPQGFLIMGKSGSGDFYDGSASNSETSFFIKCTTASTRFRVILI